jgi:hypothetical protein
MALLSRDHADEIAALSNCFGATLVTEEYDEANFGDALAVLEGPEISVRIVRDRGQLFVDLRRFRGAWVDAKVEAARLGIHPAAAGTLSFPELVGFLCANARAIGGPH